VLEKVLPDLEKGFLRDIREEPVSEVVGDEGEYGQPSHHHHLLVQICRSTGSGKGIDRDPEHHRKEDERDCTHEEQNYNKGEQSLPQAQIRDHPAERSHPSRATDFFRF